LHHPAKKTGMKACNKMFHKKMKMFDYTRNYNEFKERILYTTWATYE